MCAPRSWLLRVDYRTSGTLRTTTVTVTAATDAEAHTAARVAIRRRCPAARIDVTTILGMPRALPLPPDDDEAR